MKPFYYARQVPERSWSQVIRRAGADETVALDFVSSFAMANALAYNFNMGCA